MKLSLQAKLIAATLLVTIIVSVIITSLAFNQLKSLNESSISSEASAQSNAFTAYLSNWALDRSSAMAAMRVAMETHMEANGALSHDEALKIINQGKTSVGFGMTFVGLEDGTMHRHNPELDKNRPEYDPRARGWYKSAKKQLQPLISKPYVAATAKKLAITFVEPIIIGGEYKGAIGGLVYLDKILSDVISLTVQGDGYAVILDKSNRIVAHPNEALILKEVTELSNDLTESDLAKVNNQGSMLDINVSGEPSAAYMSSIDNTNWVLGLVMNKAVLNQPVSLLLMKISLVVLGLLALATIGVVLLIRWLFVDLKKVSEGLGNIAKGDGDLTLRIQTNANDEVGLLADNFNEFVGYLHGIISSVRDVSENLGVQAKDTAAHASSSANRVKIQQDEITMVATAVDELTKATQDIASNANNAAETANSTVCLTSAGQEQVRKSQSSINALAEEVMQTSNVILDLDKHAQEISSILSTISGIAEQTNLLALNAAIEAARAGEQGRGFAVVADEVRVLSQRTHASTEEIQSMIEVLQKTTQNAVKSMESSQLLTDTSVKDAETASESLTQIREAIVTINDMATQIATAAEEQSSVTYEINGNTNNINLAAQDLAVQSEGSKARSENLNQLTDSLKNDIRRFKL
jgi:methyl-accepting chemotaxis protein